ncbi:MAG: hypothetical protein ACI4ET_12765 [Bilifractor sp.]
MATATPAKLCKNGYWAVNGSPIYVPLADDVKISHDNVTSSDTGRTEDGKMHITWIRRDVRKIELTYKSITAAAVEYMQNLMQGKEFTFTYYDNGIKTLSGYAGKSSYAQFDLSRYASEGGLYTDYSINVVEM